MTMNPSRAPHSKAMWPARRSGVLIAVTALALAPVLTGCFNGPRATTMVQATQNSGNGMQESIGGIRIENATVVAGPQGSTTGTLIMSVFNDSREPDTLVGVMVNGTSAYVSGAAAVGSGVELAPGAALTFGYQDSDSWVNSYDLTGTAGSYVPVELQFQRSGTARMSVLIVPPTGIYQGIAPSPATRPLNQG
ncbi:MAG: hypothetical protein KGP12_03350 [Actinomycetales bacterium]|nr:hypothetical protein [Actinomycetales bacterium]